MVFLLSVKHEQITYEIIGVLIVFLLTFRYFHSISSTLAALNIGRFGCGMSLRSGGWIGHYYLSFIMLVE